MGHHIARAAGVALALIVAAGPAAAEFHGNDQIHARKLGGIVFMMNEQHMSLYTYDRDQPGVSTCYDGCAEAWPPALLEAGTPMPENYGLIPRRDGTMQIAYKNRPLYRYAGDSAIGDTRGDGVGDVWRLARPDP